MTGMEATAVRALMAEMAFKVDVVQSLCFSPAAAMATTGDPGQRGTAVHELALDPNGRLLRMQVKIHGTISRTRYGMAINSPLA